MKEVIHETYPTGGWHYVVAKDDDGEARFLHSIQVTKDKFFRGQNFRYQFNRGGVLEFISVITFGVSAGCIGFPPEASIPVAYQGLKEICDVDLYNVKTVQEHRLKSNLIRRKIEELEGETITKAQYETYKLMTNLSVLTCRPW